MKLEIDTKTGAIITPQDVRDKFKEKKVRRVFVDPENRESDQAQRFIRVVCQYYFFQEGIGHFKTFADATASIKKEFNYTVARKKDGTLHRDPHSFAMSETKFDKLLKKIEHNFMANGLVYPCSEEYNAWIKTAPMSWEIYPEMQEVIRHYLKELKEINPIMYNEWTTKHHKIIEQLF